MNMYQMLAMAGFFGGGTGTTGGAQADWNAAEGEAGHVLNRTHWVDSNPVFDGDLTGREYVDMNGDGYMYLVKITDQVVTMEELVGAALTADMGGTEQKLTLTADMLGDMTAEGIPVVAAVYDELPLFVAAQADIYITPDTQPSAGVWFAYIPEFAYVKSLSCLQGGGIVHKLDEKFIPNTIARKTDIPVIPNSDWNAAEGEAGHVLNRTHWTDTDGTVHKLDNKYIDAEWMAVRKEQAVETEMFDIDMSVTSSNSYGLTTKHSISDLPLEVGMTVTVLFDGVEYVCPVCSGSSVISWWLGDGYIKSGMSDATESTGEPFLLIRRKTDGALLIYGMTIGDHTMSLSADVTEVLPVPLPEEFLPESLDGIVIRSSTEGSTKKFRLTVDDSGAISAIEIT